MARPPALLAIAVVVAAGAVLSVAWFMSLRAGNRLASEFDAMEAHDGVLASRSGADWSEVGLQSDVALRASLDGPATATSLLLPPGVEVPASATPRPWMEGDRLHFCSPGLGTHAVVVVRGPSGEPQTLTFDEVATCPAA